MVSSGSSVHTRGGMVDRGSHVSCVGCICGDRATPAPVRGPTGFSLGDAAAAETKLSNGLSACEAALAAAARAEEVEAADEDDCACAVGVVVVGVFVVCSFALFR